MGGAASILICKKRDGSNRPSSDSGRRVDDVRRSERGEEVEQVPEVQDDNGVRGSGCSRPSIECDTVISHLRRYSENVPGKERMYCPICFYWFDPADCIVSACCDNQLCQSCALAYLSRQSAPTTKLKHTLLSRWKTENDTGDCGREYSLDTLCLHCHSRPFRFRKPAAREMRSQKYLNSPRTSLHLSWMKVESWLRENHPEEMTRLFSSETKIIRMIRHSSMMMIHMERGNLKKEAGNHCPQHPLSPSAGLLMRK